MSQPTTKTTSSTAASAGATGMQAEPPVSFSEKHIHIPSIHKHIPTVIVTGASKGIGLELVKLYLARNWRVIAAVRSMDKAGSLRVCCVTQPPTDRFKLLQLDVTDEQSINTFVKEVELLGWAVDVLVNNAAWCPPNYHSEHVWDASPQSMLKAFATNAVGPLLVTRACLKFMLDAENPRIVMVSSTAGSLLYQTEHHATGGPSYDCSKSALNTVMQRFAAELERDSRQRFTVLSLHPGHVQTDMGNLGGAKPSLTPTESATAMIDTIEKATFQFNNGKFVDRFGKLIPW